MYFNRFWIKMNPSSIVQFIYRKDFHEVKYFHEIFLFKISKLEWVNSASFFFVWATSINYSGVIVQEKKSTVTCSGRNLIGGGGGGGVGRVGRSAVVLSGASCSGGSYSGKNFLWIKLKGVIFLWGISWRQLFRGKLFSSNYPRVKSTGYSYPGEKFLGAIAPGLLPRVELFRGISPGDKSPRVIVQGGISWEAVVRGAVVSGAIVRIPQTTT